MTPSLQKFIQDHADDSLPELLLNASRYPGVDVKMAVVQIKARKQLRDKLPLWHSDERLIFPSTLAAEQCSSEITAIYKQRFVHSDDRLCDLTGGLGVDTYYFAQKVKQVTYVEKNKSYCDAAQLNFQALGVTNVHIINSDAIDYLLNRTTHPDNVNVYYMDPARRGEGNKRFVAIGDCEPDLTKVSALLPGCSRMIVKFSPMLDITQALTLIPSIREVHIVSVKNECKELLFLTNFTTNDSTVASGADPVICCTNYTTKGMEQSFRFRLSDERAAVVPLAKKVERFLYEPNASLLKAGAFKSIAYQFGVEKLHTSSHLYTSDRPVTSFQGRLFEVTDILPFSKRMCKTIHITVPQANISVRNFPVSVDEIRKRTRIKEGGDVFLFATTLPDNQTALLKCRKMQEDD